MKKTQMVYLFVLVFLLLTPLSLVQGEHQVKHTSTSDILACILFAGVTRDGYFIYNVTNLKNETIVSATIQLDVQGGAYLHGYVHKQTSLIIENLSGPLHSKLYRTQDQIFPKRLYPIFGRPIVGKVVVIETYHNQSAQCFILFLFSFIHEKIQPLSP